MTDRLKGAGRANEGGLAMEQAELDVDDGAQMGNPERSGGGEMGGCRLLIYIF